MRTKRGSRKRKTRHAPESNVSNKPLCGQKGRVWVDPFMDFLVTCRKCRAISLGRKGGE